MEPQIVEEGDPECSHDLQPHDTYDLPDPDPRNPIKVKKCTNCPREEHIETPIGYGPLPPEYTDS